MPIGLLFWFLWILAALSAAASNWPGYAAPGYVTFGSSFLWLVLFGLLGWHEFGAALHG
jgi:hypothetical protein